MIRAENHADARTMPEEIGTMDNRHLMNELHGFLPLHDYRHRDHGLAAAIYVELIHRLELTKQVPDPDGLGGRTIHEWKDSAESLLQQAEALEAEVERWKVKLRSCNLDNTRLLAEINHIRRCEQAGEK